MGTDIHGWVEYWDPAAERWLGVVKLVPLLSDRNYEVFAWLFGVRQRPDIPMRWKFSPIAAQRGLPPDASQEVVTEYTADVARFPSEYYGASWVTWREMQAVDWDEPIEDRIVESRQGQRYGATLYWRSQFLRQHADIAPDDAEAIRPGLQWGVGDRNYAVVAVRRRDALEASWELLFRIMEALASRCADSSHIRIVAWFDG